MRIVTAVVVLLALGCQDRGVQRQPPVDGRWEPSYATDQPASAPGDRRDPARTNQLGSLDPMLSGGEPSPFASPEQERTAMAERRALEIAPAK
ncbi:hypothetical protein [Sandaracinus amylolyticus]|uniref:Uncharacterized protein n=1 Tax=Sandaracinus amylolyticus TaxID=927083 RepID=A0A0F6W9E4_9BACT|nr:hypothetical protein [Sandaracinus amylolyticus]AKF10755.1 hypothetical protein DB32_007904 [Sandaracinus amylolyticus]